MSKLVLLVLATVLAAGCTSSSIEPPVSDRLSWREAGFAPREGLYEAIWLGDRVYAIDHHGGLAAFDPALGTWIQLAPFPTPREDAVLAAANGKLFALGGELHDGEIMDTVEEFDPQTGVWRGRHALPVAVCMTAAVTVDGTIYVIGGDAKHGPSASVQRYQPASDTWSLGADMPTARCVLSLTAAGGRIVALGGINLGTEKDSWTWLRTVEAYDPVSDTWETGPDLPEPRADHTSLTWRDRILVVGGLTQTEHFGAPASAGVLALDPAQGRWTEETPLQHGRYGHGVAARDGVIYILGGRRDISTPEPRIEIGTF